MLSPADQAPRNAVLLDTEAVAADLAKIAADYAGRDREMRTAVAQRLKVALAEGRKVAEQLLLKDRHGRKCAERLAERGPLHAEDKARDLSVPVRWAVAAGFVRLQAAAQ